MAEEEKSSSINVSKSDPLGLGKNWIHYTEKEKQKQRDKAKDGGDVKEEGKKGKKGKKGKGKKDAGKLYPVLDSNKINIVKFIKCMNEKNYAKANKYLQAVLENKMKARIASGI